MRVWGGAALVFAGGALAVWGARTALSGKRPLDLVAAVAAAVGVALAATGAVTIAVPGFL